MDKLISAARISRPRYVKVYTDEHLAAVKAAVEEEEKRKEEENTKYTVSMDINDLIRAYLRKYLMDNDFSEDEADEKLDEEFLDVLEDLGGGYGDYDDLLADILEVMKKHYKPRQIALGMTQLRDDGYTMFDDYIKKHL